MITSTVRKIRSAAQRGQRGQSMVELAVFLPIFILIIAGIAEMGWYLNVYLNLLDATRESARYAADLDPVQNYDPTYNANAPGYSGAVADCDSTVEFYTVIACYTLQNIPYELDPSNDYDDIILSAFTIKNGSVYNGYRYPDYYESVVDKGWSLYGNQISQFSTARINELFDDDSPDQGILIVEIYFMHKQVLALPFFTIFVPENIGVHVFTMMPNPTAGTVE
jgi:hypothetical protein